MDFYLMFAYYHLGLDGMLFLKIKFMQWIIKLLGPLIIHNTCRTTTNVTNHWQFLFHINLKTFSSNHWTFHLESIPKHAGSNIVSFCRKATTGKFFQWALIENLSLLIAQSLSSFKRWAWVMVLFCSFWSLMGNVCIHFIVWKRVAWAFI